MKIHNPYFDNIVSCIIQESKNSDNHEKLIANSINRLLPDGWSAEHSGMGSSYADVIIYDPNKQKTWVEVKMNTTDNLYNKRMAFSNGMWVPGSDKDESKSKVPMLIAAKLNADSNLKTQMQKLARQAGIKFSALTISGTYPRNVANIKAGIPSVDDFIAIWPGKEHGGKNKYIFEEPNYDLAEIAAAHYTAGKSETCPYIQMGDNFFKLGSADPLKLGVPQLKGRGDLIIRWSHRIETNTFEILVQVKLEKVESESAFSALPGTSKKNPFAKLK